MRFLSLFLIPGLLQHLTTCPFWGEKNKTPLYQTFHPGKWAKFQLCVLSMENQLPHGGGTVPDFEQAISFSVLPVPQGVLRYFFSFYFKWVFEESIKFHIV